MVPAHAVSYVRNMDHQLNNTSYGALVLFKDNFQTDGTPSIIWLIYKPYVLWNVYARHF